MTTATASPAPSAPVFDQNKLVALASQIIPHLAPNVERGTVTLAHVYATVTMIQSVIAQAQPEPGEDVAAFNARKQATLKALPLILLVVSAVPLVAITKRISVEAVWAMPAELGLSACAYVMKSLESAESMQHICNAAVPGVAAIQQVFGGGE